jgi:hypothetical protein
LFSLKIIFSFQINIEWTIVWRKPKAIKILLFDCLSFTDNHSNILRNCVLFHWKQEFDKTILYECSCAKIASYGSFCR